MHFNALQTDLRISYPLMFFGMIFRSETFVSDLLRE